MKVRIRMYRVGLGDCFLLTFAPGTEKAVHVLIDCGVLLGTADADKRMIAHVTDILEATDGHLHVVVATHEHWDHISGFGQARSVFDKFKKIDQIWFAWTELPGDDLADELRAERAARKTKLVEATKLWKERVGAGTPDGDPSLASTRVALTESVLAFAEPSLLGAKLSTADCLDYLKKREEHKEYLEPGTSRKLTDDVRVYVLGPPRDKKLLKKGKPSTKTPETYSEDDHALTLSASFFAAVEQAAGGNQDPRANPFDDHYRVPADTEDLRRNLQDSHGFYSQRYLASDEWRKIDHDWLGATGDLAIALDNDTNNTSLVLAFEIGEGDVLLFPADAQVGNWLSWKDLSFDVRDGNKRRTVTTDDLLARTAFYKVGHHASHNATLREHGLEKMKHDGLTAMIPVDRKMAEKQRWNMPFPPLFERLHEKCGGRVLRLDEGEPDGRRLRRLDTSEQTKFTKSVVTTDLYVQLTITPRS